MSENQKVSITTGSWVKGVLVVLLAYAFLLVGKFVLVLVAAIIIASSIEPITLWARRRNIPRLPTVVSIYILGALLLGGFFYFLLLPLIGEVSGFIKTLTIYSNSVINDNVLSGMFQTQNIFGGLDQPAIMTEINNYLNSLSRFLSQGVFSSASWVFGGVLSFILMLVLSFYLAVQEDGIGKFLRIIVPLKHEKYAVALWRRSQLKIGLWMQGQLLLGALVMILVYIGLLIIGVPHALLLAVVAGVLELIPLFGPILAAIPAVFVGYADTGMTTALIVGLLYLLIQQFENHLIYPMVVKKVIGMPPMVSILALVVGGQLAGLLGMLIAVPVAAVAMEFLSDLEERKIAKLSEIESVS
ncbi:MAG: AI-2E family transporter [bacterium]|nr:AI-2E family transporter [bacterium]